MTLELIYYINEYLSHVHPEQASVWFAKAIPGPEEKLWFARALRRALLRRVDDDRVIVETLSVVVRLGCRPQLALCIQELKGSSMAPLFWIMKPVQRQLCSGSADPDCDRMIFGDAVLALMCVYLSSSPYVLAELARSNWCRCTQLNLLYVLHHHFGIPFLPFLGRTFVLVACDPPSNRQSTCLSCDRDLIGWIR